MWLKSPMIGNSEVSLVLFTVLTQMAAGVVAFLLFARFTGKASIFSTESATLTKQIIFVSLIMAVVGIVSSLAHLSYPMRAYRAVFYHLSTWMGKEALLFGLFTLLLLVYSFSIYKGGMPRSGFEALISIIGLFGVVSGALVYTTLGAVPSWNNAFGLLFFLLTFLLLGGTLLSVILVNKSKYEPEPLKKLVEGYLKPFTSMLLALLIAGVVITAAYLFYLTTGGTEAAVTGKSITGSAFFWLRIVVGFLAPIYIVLMLKKIIIRGETAKVAISVNTVFVLILVGELIGRVLFFSTSVIYSLGGNGTIY